MNGHLGRRLLIVDDERHITTALFVYFTHLGYHVDVADSVDSTRGCLDGSSYAAVVTDLRLTGGPRMAGLDVIRLVRERQPRVACVVLSAYADAQNEDEAVRCGADAFLQKPAPLRRLAELLAQLVEPVAQNR